MKSLKQKLQRPYLLLFILIPLLTLLFFNGAMRLYVRQTSRQGLKQTANVLDTMIKKQLVDSLYEEDAMISSAMEAIKDAVFAAQLNYNTEILIFKSNGELAYSGGADKVIVEAPLLRKISAGLPQATSGSYTVTRTIDGSFLWTGHRLTNLPLENAPYVVYVYSQNWANQLIRSINLVLLLLMAVGIVVSIWIAAHVSRRIAKPVKELCQTAEAIGGGAFDLPGVETDIGELAALSKSIGTMSAQLQAYDKSQKDFLQHASHELRTPLMSIQGYAEGLEKGIFDDVPRAAGVIVEESRRLHALVDGLLTISRIENQTYKSSLEPVPLGEMLREIAQRLQGIALKENKTLELRIPEEKLRIQANEELLSACVQNILANALRYAAAKVELVLEAKEGQAVVTVSDDGPGINTEALPHLFERFYRGEQGQFGLGLAIAAAAVRQLGGTVGAENTGTGARFTITLPLL